MICGSKCRPLKGSSIGTNRSLSSSSPASLAFAPEPSGVSVSAQGEERRDCQQLPPPPQRARRHRFHWGGAGESAGLQRQEGQRPVPVQPLQAALRQSLLLLPQCLRIPPSVSHHLNLPPAA